MDRMSLLPMIKCSSCGVDIEILQLADHVCATASPSTIATPTPTAPNPPKLERAATFGGPSFSNRSDGPAPSGRMPPPSRIDPNAANKPFRPLSPSPISNYSDPRSGAPLSALAPPKSPFKMGRSVTTPIMRSKAPPSPDLPSNMDCAFPPFPNKGATPQSAKPQKRDRLEPTDQRYAEPSPLFAPLSPRTNGGENVSKRMDTIAPGPFDGRTESRPGTSSASRSPARDGSAYGHRRTRTQDSTRSDQSIDKQRTSLASSASRSSSYSTRSMGLPSRPKPGMNKSSGPPPPPLPLAIEQTEGIDAFLDRLQKETLRVAPAGKSSESRTNPVRKESGERRTPPPRPRRPSERDLPPNDVADMKPSGYVPYSTNRFPPRGPSRTGSETEVLPDIAPAQKLQPPPLVAPTFGNDTPSNPLHTLHTPSDSGLSDDSYASSGFRSAASSRSSPPGSVVRQSRDTSKISRFNYIAEETIERSASPESYAESRPTRGPGSYTRQNGPQPIPRALSPGYSNKPVSTMDPAIQMAASPNSRQGDTLLPQGPTSNVEKSPPRRPKTASKGECRGCSKPIVGKSVKDSSGRLTGRYHKECFVCRTCGDSFPTAEFYVFENFPYCEHHYHKLNGSLCNSCDRGIEGQYLETDMHQKFHPRCFTCATCRIVLRDDYYEVGGQRYCERHGQHAAAPPQSYLGSGGYKPRNVQKRRTRLMMMA